MRNDTVIRKNNTNRGGFVYMHPLCVSRTAEPGLTLQVLEQGKVDCGNYELCAVQASDVTGNWPCPLCHEGILDHPGDIKETTDHIKERLEYLRSEIRAERISYSEIAELQSLAEHIDPGDVELLQWAGVPEEK